LKIALFTFYYPPDLCAGSFRAGALVQALLAQLPESAHIDVITTSPNRYSSFNQEAEQLEQSHRLVVKRMALPNHNSGMLDQARAFLVFAYQVLRQVSNQDYDLICATSSRLMTAALAAYVAWRKNCRLYLDIRDIFVDTINDILPKSKAIIIKPLLSVVENFTMRRADKINLVSEGFKDYFQVRYPQVAYSYHTNGIDPEFMDRVAINTKPVNNTPLVVLYAGNMGEGQCLHAIIPALAQRFSGQLLFRLIGDGGRKAVLEQRLAELAVDNVEILPPMGREQLLQYYQAADILFLHLGDYPALTKVLPSKLFEYAAMGKPIWAGVAGYAATFIRQYIDNAAIFQPGDVAAAERALRGLETAPCQRQDFIRQFSRSEIMAKMAADIIDLAKGKP
jgi:glycosyltransferase involved in cell wall biosynthesis